MLCLYLVRRAFLYAKYATMVKVILLSSVFLFIKGYTQRYSVSIH